MHEGLLFALGKTISFIVAVFVFFFIFINIFFNTGFWHRNLLLLVGFLVFAIAFNFALPRILKALGEKKFSNGINEGAMFFARRLNDAILFIGLLLTYIIAVGFVRVISKIAGKKFLELKKSGSKTLWIEKKQITEKDYFKNQF